MLRISILLLSMSSGYVFGQISINKSNMPSSGLTVEYSTARPTNIDVSKTGADVTWDYTKIVNVDDAKEEYISSLKTPYILSFGFTTFGKKMTDTIGFGDFQFKNIYNFYQSSNASYRDVGMGFQFAALPLPQTGKHTDPDEIYVFPLEYGDVDSTTFDVEVPISAGIKIGSFYRTGTRVTTVDGWGTISTPYKSNVPCLRVKSVITELDSIRVTTPSINFGQTITRIEYKWLSTTEKIPMLTITGNVIAGTFTATSVQYRNEWSSVTPITVDFESDKVSPKQGAVVSFTNKSDGVDLSYTWSLSPSTGFIFVNGTSANHENPKIVFQDTGWYDVTLTATGNNGSKAETKSRYIHVLDKNSSVDLLSENSILVFPNPTSDVIHVNLSNSDETRLKLTSADGQEVYKITFIDDTTIPVMNVSPGLYLLHLQNETGVITRRVIVH